jgi:type VI secretion system secreted protein VgrG
MQNTRYVELEIEGLNCKDVLRLSATEAVSELFRYELEVECLAPTPDLATLVGAHATITLRDAAGGERVVTGIVAETFVLSRDTGEIVRGHFVIRPEVFRQTLGRDCWSSQDVSVPDVIRDVLADYPHTIRYDLTGSYPTYPYRVQYREDDWTYLCRIMEEEGIYYWFDHGGGESEVVFADQSKAAPPIDGIPVLPYTPASQMKPDLAAVYELSFSAHATSHVFSARSFDMKRPGFLVSASVGAGRHEVYDAPGGGTPSPEILKERVRVGLEGTKAARSGVNGVASCIRIFPGRSFEVFGHPVASLDGSFFITRVTLEGDSKVGVTSRFEGIHKDTPFRRLRLTKEARQAGLQMGVVVGPDGQEVHPDDHGRVRVQMHWDRLGPKNEKGGTWCRIAQRGAPGSMLLPRMGWNVSTFNEEGGVDAPSTLCRIHDGDHPPEYDLPANKTRVVYKTATTPKSGTHNEIYFEDRGGSEEMFIHASKDMHVRAKYRKSETIKNDSLRKVGNNYVLHVDELMGERVVQDQSVAIGGNEELVVQARYSKTVEGNEQRSVGGTRSLKVADGHVSTVEGNRTLSVGAAILDVSMGTISNTSGHNLTLVGGAVVRASAASITEDVSKLGIQLIGGARVDIANQSHPTDVEKLLNETVGAGIVLKSNARYLDNADTTSTWLTAGPLTADAPEVWAEAEEKIVIKCGASVLTITEKEIRLEGTNVDLSGAHIDADTGAIEHN